MWGEVDHDRRISIRLGCPGKETDATVAGEKGLSEALGLVWCLVY